MGNGSNAVFTRRVTDQREREIEGERIKRKRERDGDREMEGGERDRDRETDRDTYRGGVMGNGSKAVCTRRVAVGSLSFDTFVFDVKGLC